MNFQSVGQLFIGVSLEDGQDFLVLEDAFIFQDYAFLSFLGLSVPLHENWSDRKRDGV